jgi:hypothetical protein
MPIVLGPYVGRQRFIDVSAPIHEQHPIVVENSDKALI